MPFNGTRGRRWALFSAQIYAGFVSEFAPIAIKHGDRALFAFHFDNGKSTVIFGQRELRNARLSGF